jgi:hypothetical protein
MKTEELLGKLQGYVTIPVVQSTFNIDRKKAIYLIHRLRKKGYVKTKYRSDKKRVYYIYPENALGGETYLDVINRGSPIKIASWEEHRVYGKPIREEEALIYAIQRKSVRYIIACLALFRKIKDWSLLYRLAKKHDLVRKIAALYDVARLVVKKVRKMPKRFRNLAKPKKTDKYKYIINGLESRHFKDIEKKWKVYIPLNHGDLDEYRGIHT